MSVSFCAQLLIALGSFSAADFPSARVFYRSELEADESSAGSPEQALNGRMLDERPRPRPPFVLAPIFEAQALHIRHPVQLHFHFMRSKIVLFAHLFFLIFLPLLSAFHLSKIERRSKHTSHFAYPTSNRPAPLPDPASPFRFCASSFRLLVLQVAVTSVQPRI